MNDIDKKMISRSTIIVNLTHLLGASFCLLISLFLYILNGPLYFIFLCFYSSSYLIVLSTMSQVFIVNKEFKISSLYTKDRYFKTTELLNVKVVLLHFYVFLIPSLRLSFRNGESIKFIGIKAITLGRNEEKLILQEILDMTKL